MPSGPKTLSLPRDFAYCLLAAVDMIAASAFRMLTGIEGAQRPKHFHPDTRHSACCMVAATAATDMVAAGANAHMVRTGSSAA